MNRHAVGAESSFYIFRNHPHRTVAQRLDGFSGALHRGFIGEKEGRPKHRERKSSGNEKETAVMARLDPEKYCDIRQ